MEVIFNWRTIVLQGCGGLCYLLLFTPLFLPSRLLQSARLAPCVIAQISLVTYFTHDSIYMSVLLSQFVPPSPSCAVSTRPFSMSTSSFLLCKQVHQYYFSRFLIHALCVCMRVCSFASVTLDSLQPHGLWPARLLCPWDSPSKNTRVHCHALLQGIFLTQELNPDLLCLLHWQVGSLPLEPPGSPIYAFSSVQFSRSVVSDSLQPHKQQHTRPPCPSSTPRVHPNPCPSSR